MHKYNEIISHYNTYLYNNYIKYRNIFKFAYWILNHRHPLRRNDVSYIGIFCNDYYDI